MALVVASVKLLLRHQRWSSGEGLVGGGGQEARPEAKETAVQHSSLYSSYEACDLPGLSHIFTRVREMYV